MQRADGESVYLRLTTRSIRQVERANEEWKAGAIQGGYWLRPPAPGAEAALVYSGAIAPEALAAWEALQDDVPGLGLLAITSPDLLHRGWSASRSSRWKGRGTGSQVEQLLAPLSRSAGLVTLLDGAPASLSWLGGVHGHRVSPLGLDRFGQTGSLPISTGNTGSTWTRSWKRRPSSSFRFSRSLSRAGCGLPARAVAAPHPRRGSKSAFAAPRGRRGA
jgi:pyruvate dehydrogenase E1 component